MDLKSYLDGRPRGELKELAAKLKLSAIYLSQLVARQNDREPSPALCVRIEQVTGGKVTRRDLRPDDWAAIWPELTQAA